MAYKNGSRVTGGKAYRQHQSLKKFIRERDNYTCQLCGKEGWIVDHRVPWAISHDSKIDNLRVLCHACNLKLRRKRSGIHLHLKDWFAYLDNQLQEENQT